MIKSTIRPVHELLSAGFNWQTSNRLIMVAEVDPFSFSALLINEQNEVAALFAYTFQSFNEKEFISSLEQIKSVCPVFHHEFRQVLVNWHSQHFTLVPSVLDSSDMNEKFLSFNLDEIPAGRICSDEIKPFGARLIYAIPEKVYDFLSQNFPSFQLRHSSSVFLEFNSRKNKDVYAFVHFNEEGIEVMISGKKLLFFNAFNVGEPEDMLYYILTAMENNGLDPHVNTLWLSGKIENGSLFYDLLSKYVKDIRFSISDQSLKKSESFFLIPEHFYFNMYNRLFCA